MAEIPRRGGVTVLAGPSKGQAMMMTYADTSPAEMRAEMLWLAAQMRGQKLTPELREAIERDALEYEAQEARAIKARGVAKDLRKLFRAERKKLALRIARTMVLSGEDLYDLICNCGDLGLSHHPKHLEFVPEERRLTPEDDAAFYNLNGGRTPESLAKAMSRLEQIFEEREHRSVHLFADSRDRWHCFFLTFRDIAGDPVSGEHHWSQGSHVHYISHLFDPRISKQAVWEAVDERRHNLPAEHVRFRDSDLPPDPGFRVVANPQLGRGTKVKV